MKHRWWMALAAAVVAAALLLSIPGFTAAAPQPQQSDVTILSLEGDGWLGVGIAEVTAQVAKDKKLPAERGVLVSEVETGSPADKAGVKAGDVITEYNGMRIEGGAQLRRMVRETPAGRSVQLTVWREGRAQTLSAEMGRAGDRVQARTREARPEDLFDFSIRLPSIDISIPRGPALGVSIEDVSGQLGGYFGVPGEEGVLVREVRSGSAAEKAGMKAGDVIIKVDGARVRNSGELRSKLRDVRESRTVAVGVIRNRAEVTVNVELEAPRPPERRSLSISRRAVV